MSSRKKVTIGLPVYNGESYLAGALDSLLAQTYGDFELIISDNASTDATQTICLDYAKRDARIRYTRLPRNTGAIANFNRVFEISDSNYFKWASVDDRCDPTFLEKAVAVLDSHPDVVWCHSRSSHIDTDGNPIDEPGSQDVSYAGREAGRASDRFRDVILGDDGCLDSYGLFRSDILARTPLYLPYYGPEKVLMAELALLGRYKEIPHTLFFACVAPEGSGNISTAKEQQAFIDPQRIRRLYLTRLRFLLGYITAIWRSAPTFADAARCGFHVLHWVFQVSKWRSVIVRALSGRGVGGGNVERVKRISRRGKPARSHGSHIEAN